MLKRQVCNSPHVVGPEFRSHVNRVRNNNDNNKNDATKCRKCRNSAGVPPVQQSARGLAWVRNVCAHVNSELDKIDGAS